MNILRTELRRSWHRRVVRVLIVLALVASAVAGVIAFASSSGKEVWELQRDGELHPAVLTAWWVPAVSDGALMISTFFLLLGGLFGGASVAGAEWRAGTVTTVLTWEPRRTRLLLARTAACGLLAFLISFVLQAVFLASFLPAVLANGTTAGAHLDWWNSLGLAMARTSVLTAVAAVVGVALATLGRNTAFALVAAFAWVTVAEGLVRGLRPAWAEYLWGENLATVIPWDQMEGVEFRRGPLLALLTVLVYGGVFLAAAAISFHRRDVAGAT